MKIERLPFFALLLMPLLLAGCNSDSASQSNFSVEIRTVDANGVDTVEFSQGELIVIEMPIVNLLNESRMTSLSDSGHPVFCIRRATEQDCLWNSNFGLAFPQVLVDVAFQPLETRMYGATCDQLANEGTAFGHGEYEVMGRFGFDSQGNVLESTWHSFAILG